MFLSAAARWTRRTRLARAGLALAFAITATIVQTPDAAGAQFAPPETQSPNPKSHKATLSLWPDRDAYEPGSAARISAEVSVAEGWHLQAHQPTYDYLIPTVLRVEVPEGWGDAAIDYPAPHKWKFAFADDPLDVYEGTPRIFVRLTVPANAPEGNVTVRASLRYQACDDKQCLPPVEAVATAELRVGAGGVAANAEHFAPQDPARPAATSQTTTAKARAPWTVLLFALLGGFILNGMPCVLPILSLKLFGLVKSSGQSRGAIRSGALAASAGILVSFWALAGAAIVAKQAGAAIGWGVQFQQPGFVAFLAIVVLLFSLNLWGLFEIPLPARLARLGDAAGGASGQASGQASDGNTGLGGHFASGLFSTLMATPCSAPFLGTALSFALGQSGGVIFAVLTAVGVGLALPYLLLAAAPRAAALLPRPGAWMDTLRGVLGFLLASAVVWLLFVLSGQIDPVSLALFEIGLLVLALFVWIRHRRFASGKSTAVAWLFVAAAAIGLILFANRAPRATRGDAATSEAGSISWIPFDRAEAERLAASGRLVFLDITADWCVTCKVNEKIILGSPDVQAAFRELDIVAVKADWTNRDDTIARFLAEHGRYGIPFYMLYRPNQAPHVFGELLTKDGVLDVLRAAPKG